MTLEHQAHLTPPTFGALEYVSSGVSPQRCLLFWGFLPPRQPRGFRAPADPGLLVRLKGWRPSPAASPSLWVLGHSSRRTTSLSFRLSARSPESTGSWPACVTAPGRPLLGLSAPTEPCLRWPVHPPGRRMRPRARRGSCYRRSPPSDDEGSFSHEEDPFQSSSLPPGRPALGRTDSPELSGPFNGIPRAAP